ncbi:MAG: hypothetical protein UX79_C0004G0025 [candidate division WWE3 bacterium GW2011_GWB1_47_11]|uniref:Uncharacterized protein n=1 Tax=candidate division WWE3 bacterium GW2011_GWB1_47_11 TaxID=1619117 RepID=A0A0G1RKM2_UNCKA|nr:MAG: hypothetical protein UX79_C0004G0025 [candidate division WWE3 bacterium GW2011_GWB1_47_11]
MIIFCLGLAPSETVERRSPDAESAFALSAVADA